jgi:hypothetical protein
MGREIRMVPPNWEHPKKLTRNWWPGEGYKETMQFQPMHDEPFAAAMDQWYSEWKQWEVKTHPDYDPEYPEYWEYAGNPPNPEYYRPSWPDGSATWFQVYETVSEGSPVTPPFATKEDLIEYLVKYGDEWDQSRTAEGRQASAGWPRHAAEQFVKQEYAPSMVVIQGGPNAGIYTAATGFPASGDEKP